MKMSFHNLSEFNVIVLSFESSTIIPILTITSRNGFINQSLYPSIIVNIFNETNVFINNNSSFITNNITTKVTNKNDTNFQNSVIVPLYAVIFLLSVVGNLLVILTLAQNKRMRTVTNVYLLNLAVSDLLLGVFCMPFTLVGQMLRNFIFGKTMCKLIPYAQAVSVSVAVWTLVAISLERYFAICRPLTSRRWQTQFHAYKMIALVWLISFVCNSPLILVQQLQPMSRGGEGAMKCREVWPSSSSERTYVIFLDIALLFLPLVSMGLAYSLIVSKLWRGLKREMNHTICTKDLKRSPSLNTVNGVLITGTNSDTTTYSTLTSPGRSKNRVILHSAPQLNNQNYVNIVKKKNKRKSAVPNFLKTNKKNPKKQRAEAVKLWLLKSIVQVRPNGKKNHSPPTSFKRNGTLTSTQQQQPATTNNCSTNYNTTNNHETIISEIIENGNAIKDDNKTTSTTMSDVTTYTFCRHAIRSTYMDKSIEAKKKVIRMLFVIIVEFFVCWAPIHILNTVYLFSPAFVYHHVSSTGIALVQLMAYISSCCNPITYCFMNRRFRQAFMAIFNCYKCRKFCCTQPLEPNDRLGRHELIAGMPCHSDASGNDSIVYLGRTNGLNRSEVLVLEAEDRV